MGFEFAVYRMSHVVEIDADSFAPGEPKCRNQIAVPSDHHNDLGHLAQGDPGYVQTNSQIDTFLFDVGYEIPSERSPRTGLHVTGCTRAQFPSVKNSFTTANSKMWHKFQPLLQRLGFPGAGGLAEVDFLMIDWVLDHLVRRWRIVKIESQELAVGQSQV